VAVRLINDMPKRRFIFEWRGRHLPSPLLRRLTVTILFAATLVSAITALSTVVRTQANALTDKGVEDIALRWFEQMRTGQIDRTQLTSEYSTQLTDDAVKKMSAYLNEYKYGASPTGAEILRTRTIGEQTFYDVKLTFPRGDAASLLLGFNAEGKITGITLMSMAGD
jgi:hypothetical protein